MMVMERRRYRKGSNRADCIIQVRLAAKERANLAGAAAREGKTLSEFVRGAASRVVLPSVFDYASPLTAVRALVVVATEPTDRARAARYGAAPLDWWDANWRMVLSQLGWMADQMAVVESLIHESEHSA